MMCYLLFDLFYFFMELEDSILKIFLQIYKIDPKYYFSEYRIIPVFDHPQVADHSKSIVVGQVEYLIYPELFL